jgi:rare lipoprotein A
VRTNLPSNFPILAGKLMHSAGTCAAFPQHIHKHEDEMMVRGSTVCFAIACTMLFGIASNAQAQSGIASVYSYKSGRTASGEHAHPSELTAAHRSLPFGTKVRVTNRRNGHSVVVRINDRGPFVRGRVIDVTPAAAHALGFSGVAPVALAVVK